MKKFKLGTAIVAIVVVAGTMFYACKKDVIQNEQVLDRNVMKSTGNYQQPTQIVDINTFITVGTVRYPVVGSAVVGNYNGQIYECNVEWTMQVANEDFTMRLNAMLKPEYNDITTFVAPAMDNYIITVTNPDMLTDESNANLWANMVDIVNENVVIETKPFSGTLKEYIYSSNETSDMFFYEEHIHNIIDNIDVVKSCLAEKKYEDMENAKFYFKHGRNGCPLALGICIIFGVDMNDDFNVHITMHQEKLLVFPIDEFDNGITSDGYFPIFEDYDWDGIILKAGIYKAYRDTNGKRGIAIDIY